MRPLTIASDYDGEFANHELRYIRKARTGEDFTIRQTLGERQAWICAATFEISEMLWRIEVDGEVVSLYRMPAARHSNPEKII